MIERQCRYCERIFQPSKYQPGQSVCSEPGCQRRRRADYHHQKIAADPEYRLVCRDSPQKWRSRNPDYWRRIVNSTGHPSSGTATSNKFETKNGIFAILQTTTQLRRKSGFWKHFRRKPAVGIFKQQRPGVRAASAG